MVDIQELRKRVDEVDEQILNALSERAKICRAIGLVKKKQGMQIRDASRENELYKHVKEKAVQFHLDPLQVEAVYREIVNMCSAVQG
ncbi:chorismate mutase [Candidatus Bathyarchaeota archaeon]|jgi:chorismate mutase|nr:chorismate mutase [Candidatus Bathyarchaeota archaeon]